MEEISRYHRLFKFPNGATLIYYKHNVNNTTQFAVGFVGGSRVDGKIKGTAHFLEHMLCKETPKISLNQFNKFIRNNNINSNAFTSENYLVLYADTPNSSLNETCKVYSELLSNKHFKKDSIDLERMAINQEILIAKDDDSGFEEIRRLIQKNFRPNAVLGTKNSIAKIDEGILKDYINKNFVSENLVISVVSNLEFDEIKNIIENNFVHVFPSNPELINKPFKPQYYPPANIISANVIEDCKTINIDILYSTNQTEKEANLYALVEDYIFNGFSGKLLKKLRTEKGLVYSANFEPLVLSNNLSFKCISACTSKKHINEVIDSIGEIISDIVKNGISEKDYFDFQKMVASMEERRSGIKTISPLTLLDRYVDDREIFFNNQIHSIKNLSRENINEYLRKVYKKANIMLSIDGDFNPNKLYNIHEIEKRLHAKQSKLLYHRGSQMLLFPDNYDLVNKEIPTKFLSKLEDDGFIGFIDGNYFGNIIYDQLMKFYSDMYENIGDSITNLQDKENPKNNSKIVKTCKDLSQGHKKHILDINSDLDDNDDIELSN